MRYQALGLVLLLGVAGCGGPPGEERAVAGTTEVADATAPVRADAAAGERAIAGPIAYAYALAYRVAGARIDDVQRAHEDRCELLGRARCVVLGTTLDGRDGQFGRGTLDLLVAPDVARRLTRAFDAIVSEAEGDLIQSRVEGEAVDVALLAARAAATDRARTRDAARASAAARADGWLEEKVAADMAAAEAGAAVEAAAGALATLEGRLKMSRISVTYESRLPVDTDRGRPVAQAWARAGGLFGESLGLLLTVLAAAAPFGALAGAIWWMRRAGGRRARAL